MKTTPVESMEELIFRNRNKAYGAYSLRKNYKNNMMIAMFIAILLVGSALTFPIIMTPDKIVPVQGDTITITFEPIHKTDPEPLKPPPDPPASEVKAPKDLALRVPKVTDEPIEPSDFGKQDVLASNSNTPVAAPGSTDFIGAPDARPESLMPPVEKPEPLTIVQEMPSFPGGIDAMIKFIKTHLKYPAEAREMNITGTVYIGFVVETDGSITEISVARPIGGGCEEEAMRVLKSMPNWIAGKQNGRAVRVRLTLPVKFVLSE